MRSAATSPSPRFFRLSFQATASSRRLYAAGTTNRVRRVETAMPPMRAIAIGPGAELQRPMALSIVGGMIVSTGLTLFVVPAAYSLLDDAVAWNATRKARGDGILAALRARSA